MAEDKVPMTVLGKRLLDEELRHLLSVERPSVIKAIEIARSHGDLSENADYSAAKERQSFIEGRIQEINAKIAMAQVIDPKSIKSERIVFGASVKLLEVDKDEEVQYQIVGVDEADAKQGKIGITSPIARALIGKSVGDEVIVNAPKGKFTYEVVEISYV
jgi:transcription elongation factor GreA